MPGFVRGGPAFSADPATTEPIILVPLLQIAPPERKSRRNWLFDEDRLESILTALCEAVPLPPIELEQLSSGRYRYKVRHGAHRYYASAAAGFSQIPAVIRESFDYESWAAGERAKCKR